MVMSPMRRASRVFLAACRMACWAMERHDDDAIVYAVKRVPVYAQYTATEEQARAGGCPTCTYLGLWTDRWPGYGVWPHGIIWLFEDGNQQETAREDSDLTAVATRVLHHELGHALQRDHVLDALERTRRQFIAAGIRFNPRTML